MSFGQPIRLIPRVGVFVVLLLAVVCSAAPALGAQAVLPEELVATSKGHALTVLATPGSSTIKILNIDPKYAPGILLQPGEYVIEVSSPGFKTKVRQVEIVDQDLMIEITLEQEAPPGSVSVGGVAAGVQAAQALANFQNYLPQATLRLSPGDNLSDALRTVPAGALIVLDPGTYRADALLRIGKSVKLVGSGPDVVTVALGAGLEVRGAAGLVHFEGIGFELSGSVSAPVILAVEPNLSLSQCRVSGGTLSGLEIQGGTAQLRYCELTANRQSGLLLHSGTTGSFSNNRFYDNGLHGVEVRAGAAPNLRANVFYANGQSGAFIQDGAGGVYIENLFLENQVGLVLNNGQGVVANNNEIRANPKAGVHVTGSTSHFTKNVIECAGGPAIKVVDSPQTIFMDNHVSGQVDGIKNF